MHRNTQPFTPSLWDGGRIGKKNVKLVCWDKNYLLKQKRKAEILVIIYCTYSQTEWCTIQLLIPHQGCPASSWAAAAPLANSPQFYSVIFFFHMMSYGMKYPFGWSGSTVLVLPPLSSLCPSGSTSLEIQYEKLKNWNYCVNIILLLKAKT